MSQALSFSIVADKLPPLSDYDYATNLKAKNFKRLEVSVSNKRHLFFALVRIFRIEYLNMAASIIVMVMSNFTSPICINRLLECVGYIAVHLILLTNFKLSRAPRRGALIKTLVLGNLPFSRSHFWDHGVSVVHLHVRELCGSFEWLSMCLTHIDAHSCSL
jgi:hypothetical protein